MRLWLAKFWCIGKVVACGWQPLARGGSIVVYMVWLWGYESCVNTSNTLTKHFSAIKTSFTTKRFKVLDNRCLFLHHCITLAPRVFRWQILIKKFKLFSVTMFYGDFCIHLLLSECPHYSQFFPCKMVNPILLKTLAVLGKRTWCDQVKN